MTSVTLDYICVSTPEPPVALFPMIKLKFHHLNSTVLNQTGWHLTDAVGDGDCNDLLSVSLGTISGVEYNVLHTSLQDE